MPICTCFASVHRAISVNHSCTTSYHIGTLYRDMHYQSAVTSADICVQIIVWSNWVVDGCLYPINNSCTFIYLLTLTTTIHWSRSVSLGYSEISAPVLKLLQPHCIAGQYQHNLRTSILDPFGSGVENTAHGQRSQLPHPNIEKTMIKEISVESNKANAL